jgi:hypothetical protein
MHFRQHTSGALEIFDLHPLLAGLVTELPNVAGRHEKARARLFPDPVGQGEHEELRSDWTDHVQPELERFFASSRAIVARDIAGLPPEANRLLIPCGHADAWLNCLNQARLIIVEENLFTEAEMDHRQPPDLSTRRGLALLKVHFYAHLQEALVEVASS